MGYALIVSRSLFSDNFTRRLCVIRHFHRVVPVFLKGVPDFEVKLILDFFLPSRIIYFPISGSESYLYRFITIPILKAQIIQLFWSSNWVLKCYNAENILHTIGKIITVSVFDSKEQVLIFFLKIGIALLKKGIQIFLIHNFFNYFKNFFQPLFLDCIIFLRSQFFFYRTCV